AIEATQAAARFSCRRYRASAISARLMRFVIRPGSPRLCDVVCERRTATMRNVLAQDRAGQYGGREFDPDEIIFLCSNLSELPQTKLAAARLQRKQPARDAGPYELAS